MIPDYTSPVLQVEDLSYLHIDDYIKKTILSKAGDFGTGFPRIVEDNARSFTSMPLTTNEKKMKKSKNGTRRQVIPPKSLIVPVEFIKSDDLPLYNMPLTKPQERWSNGIMDVAKDANPACSRFYSKRSMGKNLTAALARDSSSICSSLASPVSVSRSAL